MPNPDSDRPPEGGGGRPRAAGGIATPSAWPGAPALPDPAAVERALLATGYIADPALATSCFLAIALERPLLLEGETGSGKTELAKALAEVLHAPLIRLQCYEGIDIGQALYEWNHPRQLLAIRQTELRGSGPVNLYGAEFLARRPLLQALDPEDGRRPVLLVDELDRADDEFEAFLLELLSDWQVTIPELGPVRSEHPPAVILTSNRTRELHDAIKRRCLFHWLELPTLDTERRIVRTRLPWVGERLARAVTAFVGELRALDLYKPPGVAETLDWTRALAALGADDLSLPAIDLTLGSLLKYQEDLATVRATGVAAVLERSRGHA